MRTVEARELNWQDQPRAKLVANQEKNSRTPSSEEFRTHTADKDPHTQGHLEPSEIFLTENPGLQSQSQSSLLLGDCQRVSLKN